MAHRFWTEPELETRDILVKYFTRHITSQLIAINPGFKVFRIETPLVDRNAMLRSSMCGGCDEYAKDLMYNRRYKLPLIVWQQGPTFTTTPTGIDFCNGIEYKILYSTTTATDYLPHILKACREMLSRQCGPVTAKGNEFISDIMRTVLVQVEQQRQERSFVNSIEISVAIDACVDAFREYELAYFMNQTCTV